MKKQNAKSRNSVIKSGSKKKGDAVRRENKPSKKNKAKVNKPPVKHKAASKQVRVTKKAIQLINKKKYEKSKRKQNSLVKSKAKISKVKVRSSHDVTVRDASKNKKNRKKVTVQKNRTRQSSPISGRVKQGGSKKKKTIKRSVHSGNGNANIQRGKSSGFKNKATNEQILKLLAKVISDNKKFKASLKKKDAEIIKLKKRGTPKRPANIQARNIATDGKNKALGDKTVRRKGITPKKRESSHNAYSKGKKAKGQNGATGRFTKVSDKNTNRQREETIKPFQKKAVKKQAQKKQTKKEQSEVTLLRYQRNYQKSKIRSLLKLIEHHRELQAKDEKLKVSFEGKDNVPNTYVLYQLNQRVADINGVISKINAGIKHYGGKIVLGKMFAPISLITPNEFVKNNIITIAAGKHYDLDRMYGFLKYLKLNTFNGFDINTHSFEITKIFNEAKSKMESKHIYWLIWKADLSESWGYIDTGSEDIDSHTKLPLGMKYTDLQLLSVNKQEEIKEEKELPLGLRYSALSDDFKTGKRKEFLKEGLEVINKNNPTK